MFVVDGDSQKYLIILQDFITFLQIFRKIYKLIENYVKYAQ